jgi:DNA-binding transcriptional ArsR family regulator
MSRPEPRLIYYPRMHADNGRVDGLPDEQVDLAVEVFRMLADPTRVRVLWALSSEELSVGEIAAAVGKNPSAVSQHLAKLRMARLVRTRREGTTVHYRLENEHVARLVRDAIYNAEHAGDAVPRHHHDATEPTDATVSRIDRTETR